LRFPLRRLRRGDSAAFANPDEATMLRLALLAIVTSSAAMNCAVAQQAVQNSGEPALSYDISKPVDRLDYFVENSQSSGGATTWTSKFRYERPFDLYDSWKIAVRVELPVVTTNDTSSGLFATGYGDTQFQAVISKELDASQGFGFGVRFWAPTASGDEFGNGRWRMAPSAGYRYSLPDLSDGSYFQFLARYQFDFAGDPNLSHTSNLQFAPSLNIGLPQGWSVTLFPSTDIRYDFMKQQWFVPFDLEIAKQWNPKFLTGIEIGLPLFETANPVYKFKVEGHVALRF
jgi:hypothetical protein